MFTENVLSAENAMAKAKHITQEYDLPCGEKVHLEDARKPVIDRPNTHMVYCPKCNEFHGVTWQNTQD